MPYVIISDINYFEGNVVGKLIKKRKCAYTEYKPCQNNNII